MSPGDVLEYPHELNTFRHVVLVQSDYDHDVLGGVVQLELEFGVLDLEQAAESRTILVLLGLFQAIGSVDLQVLIIIFQVRLVIKHIIEDFLAASLEFY
jgi:hypothetical protein